MDHCQDGCRELHLLDGQINDLWLEVADLKSSVSALQGDLIRSEERISALTTSIDTLKELINKTSERTDNTLAEINQEIKKISEKVHKQEAIAKFNITWKEILAISVGAASLLSLIINMVKA